MGHSSRLDHEAPQACATAGACPGHHRPIYGSVFHVMTAWIAAASPGTTARAAAGRASVRPDLWPCFSIRAHCGSRDGQLRAEAMRSMASAGTALLVPKFSHTKPLPGVPNPWSGFECDAATVEEHTAWLLAISDTSAVQGRKAGRLGWLLGNIG